MSREQGFGKKEREDNPMGFEEVKGNKCPDCGQDLVSLEHVFGENFVREGKRFYSSYDVLYCCDCHKKYKRLADEYEYIEEEDPGLGSKRWR